MGRNLGKGTRSLQVYKDNAPSEFPFVNKASSDSAQAKDDRNSFPDTWKQRPTQGGGPSCAVHAAVIYAHMTHASAR